MYGLIRIDLWALSGTRNPGFDTRYCFYAHCFGYCKCQHCRVPANDTLPFVVYASALWFRVPHPALFRELSDVYR
jgi:hypothetical protein